MKAVLAVLAPAVLLAGPAFADQAHDVLKTSLASATRQEMSVAPWVSISVPRMDAGEKLEWIAMTGARQVYLCSAAGTVESGLAGRVDCAHVEPTATQRAAAVRSALYTSYSRDALQQRKRLSVAIPVAMNGDLGYGAVTTAPTVVLTLPAY